MSSLRLLGRKVLLLPTGHGIGCKSLIKTNGTTAAGFLQYRQWYAAEDIADRTIFNDAARNVDTTSHPPLLLGLLYGSTLLIYVTPLLAILIPLPPILSIILPPKMTAACPSQCPENTYRHFSPLKNRSVLSHSTTSPPTSSGYGSRSSLATFAPGSSYASSATPFNFPPASLRWLYSAAYLVCRGHSLGCKIASGT
jgi:hypothetical protein